MWLKNIIDRIKHGPKIRHIGVHMAKSYPALTQEQIAAQDVLYQKIYNKLSNFSESETLEESTVNVATETYTEEQSDQIYGRIKIDCGDKGSVFVYLDRREDPCDTRAWHVQGTCGLVDPTVGLVTAILNEYKASA